MLSLIKKKNPTTKNPTPNQTTKQQTKTTSIALLAVFYLINELSFMSAEYEIYVGRFILELLKLILALAVKN